MIIEREMMEMINIRKRGNVYQYGFEVGKVNGKRKQITKVVLEQGMKHLQQDKKHIMNL